MNCANCKQNISDGESFCSYCGTPINTKNSAKSAENNTSTKTIHSSGSYSGNMIKSKTSKSLKKFKYIILAVVLVALIVFVVWFNTDPDAKEKLGNFLFGAVFILIFGFIIWRKNKKGKMLASKYREPNYNLDELDEQQFNTDNFDDDNFDDSDDD